MGFVIDVRLGDTPDDMDEALRLDPLAVLGAQPEGVAGQELVGVVASSFLHAGLIDRADQRMFHPCLRAYVGDERLAVRPFLEFLHQHHAPHGNLLGQPCPGGFRFRQAFLGKIIAEPVLLFAEFFHIGFCDGYLTTPGAD